MCGILGLLANSDDRGLESQGIAASRRLRRRGPDGFGHWTNAQQRVFLGHRRLAMTGGANAAQPLFNEDGSVAAIVNGEFYGYQEMRRTLEGMGHQFSTQSDCEIVVHLYEEYGDAFPQWLRGEFAVILWDQRRQRMYGVRDRFGIKPLLVSESRRGWGMASNAKALFPFVDDVKWDMRSLFFATHLQYLPVKRSLFRGIQQVPAGHWARVDSDGLSMESYWDLDYPDQAELPSSLASDDQGYLSAVSQCRKMLVESVVERCPPDVPYCFHLSGGIDSSAILGIASRELGNQTAFTIAFDNQQYDEGELANAMARSCGATLHAVKFTHQDCIDGIHEAAVSSEGLAINGHLVAKWLMNQSIHQAGFKGVLTGEGADETFLGYAHLHMDWLLSQNQMIDQAGFEQANASSVGIMLPFGDSLPTEGLQRIIGLVPTFMKAKATLGARVQSLLNDDLTSEWGKEDAFEALLSELPGWDKASSAHPVHRSAWLWNKLALGGYILKTLGDGTEMAWSIEGRTPYLDHKLFQWARSIPMDCFFTTSTAKRILRHAVAPFVPQAVAHRIKRPLATPPILVDSQTASIEFLNDQINSEAFRTQPCFDFGKTKRLIESIPSMTLAERKAWDPAVIMLSCVMGLQKLISDTNRSTPTGI